MDPVAQHYESLLAKHYVWMNGMTLEAQVSEQRGIFEDFGVAETAKRLAVDLGCGPGFQSLALAAKGFEHIMAIDTNQSL